MSSLPIIPTNAASPPRLATPFATFAADPPGQYVGSTPCAGTSSLKDRDGVSSAPAPVIHCSPHAARSDLMSSSESTGTHPPGSEMPHASKTRAARLGSSRRTRMSLTGSPRPTRSTEERASTESSAVMDDAGRRATGAAGAWSAVAAREPLEGRRRKGAVKPRPTGGEAERRLAMQEADCARPPVPATRCHVKRRLLATRGREGKKTRISHSL